MLIDGLSLYGQGGPVCQVVVETRTRGVDHRRCGAADPPRRFSRKDLTLAQQLIIPVLRKFWNTDYHGAVIRLGESPNLRRAMKLK